MKSPKMLQSRGPRHIFTLLRQPGHVASTQLRLFASPIFSGGLSPACATSMCKGSYYDGHVKRGQKADPNSPGLEGMTALMHMINEGPLLKSGS